MLLVTHEVDEAEALCDRVVVHARRTRHRRGTPAELVRRYGAPRRWFALPPGRRRPAGRRRCSSELRRLDGVRDVDAAGSGVTVSGDRRIIAHVGAILVRHGMVPDDLDVQVPSLEDAVLTLLERRRG